MRIRVDLSSLSSDRALLSFRTRGTHVSLESLVSYQSLSALQTLCSDRALKTLKGLESTTHHAIHLEVLRGLESLIVLDRLGVEG